ncbi:MAG TPA: hypothetical protein DCO79_00670 [Spirochaeta sp.]|nr:hypothetical protein [Spirochaeta sp.]
MKNWRKGILLALVLVLVTSFAFAGGNAETDSSGRKFYRFGGGKPGGSWFVMVGGLSSYLSAQSDTLNITAIGGGGSLGNNRSARAGDIDLWFTHALTAYENWNGTGSFDEEGEFQDFRMISGVYENLHHWIVLEDSGIDSFSDLAGKKVNFGAAGSGGAVNAENTLKALGLLDKVNGQYLSWDASGKALADGQLDAIAVSSAPEPVVITIEATKKIKVLTLNDQEFSKVIEQYPIYYKGFIKPGTYKAVTEPEPVVAFQVFWAAQKDVEADAVYEMLSIAFKDENKESIAQIYKHLTQMNDGEIALESLKIPYHAGAVKFWQDNGITIPDYLIPPEMK